MSTLETATLWVHIGAGVVAILAGVGALGTTKGGLWHRRAGRVFVSAMAVVVGTVLPLLVLDPSSLRVFLTLVAVFSGYLAFSGYRVLSRKRPDADPDGVDWVAAAGVLVACLLMGGWGVARLVGGDTFGSVLVVFGAIGIALGGADVRAFRAGDTDDPTPWTVTHLQRMIAAFIATISAVSAVNLTPHMGFLAWLWPTAVGTPLIAYWSREYDSE